MSLNDRMIRDEASDLIRSLINEITHPRKDESGVDAVAQGDPGDPPRRMRGRWPEKQTPRRSRAGEFTVGGCGDRI